MNCISLSFFFNYYKFNPYLINMCKRDTLRRKLKNIEIIPITTVVVKCC